MSKKYDFSGYATKNDLRCSDGRTIRRNAFKDNDGQTVPLVWQHMHDNPGNVLGHALLENRNDGVYAYCKFNETDAGKNAKLLVEHGDVTALSIYANKLRQKGGDVLHGSIREVSLVLAGANPGALIDFPVLAHGEEAEDEAVIYTDEFISLSHSDEDQEEETNEIVEHSDDNKDDNSDENKGEKKMDNEKTVKDVFDSLNEEQKNVVYFLIGQAVEDAKGENGGNEEMKHNVFENEVEENVLSHAEMQEIIADGKRYGSMKESFLQHGITDIENLFPEVKAVSDEPDLLTNEDAWVSKVMNGVKHTPFARIKSTYANCTADEARAKGYVKGNEKVDEVIVAFKRTTTPTTVYKKQSLDRDDVIDITDFDVIAWLKKEMRGMLDEEIARAILIGDGRDAATDNDKINEQCIRPIWGDASAYTDNTVMTYASTATDDDKAKMFIKAVIKNRKNYKGSGNPTLFCGEDMLTSMLLLEDNMGRELYESVDKLATKLRVKEIVTVPQIDAASRTASNKTYDLAGVIVNLKDYNVGADKGGNVSMFDDFDIDFNKQKYLIETRCSGALIRPKSAQTFEFTAATSSQG